MTFFPGNNGRIKKARSKVSSNHFHARNRFGFTLLELLLVIAVIAVMAVIVTPAVTSIKTADDVTNASYAIRDALEMARTVAMANNTYVWVGFFEESAATASTNPATPGVGRIVISCVASKDGTTVYDPNNLAEIDATRITQTGKLIKIEGVHLAKFADGTGSGDNFDSRPPANYDTARISDSTPPSTSKTPFRYPVGSTTSTPQYMFVKAIEFSPRGEGRVDNSNYSLKPIIEIALQPAHGVSSDVSSRNVAAVQFGGFGGNFKIYRR